MDSAVRGHSRIASAPSRSGPGDIAHKGRFRSASPRCRRRRRGTDRELREDGRRPRVNLGNGIRALQVRDGLADRAVPDRLMRASVEYIDHDRSLVLDPGPVISPAAAPAVAPATPTVADAPARPPAGI